MDQIASEVVVERGEADVRMNKTVQLGGEGRGGERRLAGVAEISWLVC